MSESPSKLPGAVSPTWTFSALDLTENSPIAIIEWDPNMRVRYWNPRAEEMFGWTEEEVLGGYPGGGGRPFVYEDDNDLAVQAVRRLLTGQEPWNFCRNRNYRRDGSVILCDWYSYTLRDARGQLLCILSQIVDVTERERTLLRLEESERRFKATFEQAAVGIAHVSVDGRCLRANLRLCEILGYTPEEMLEQTFLSVTHPDDVAQDLEQVRWLLRGTAPMFAVEKRYLRKTGEEVWCNLTVSLVRRPDGTPDYFISVIEDISRRHRAELERDALLAREHQARTEAEELVRRRSSELAATRSALVQAERLATAGQLAAGVGHEINNPLAYVLANVMYAVEELAQLKAPTPEVDMEEIQRALVQAQLGAERIRDIVRDLRIFARGDPEAIGPVDVQAALEFSIAMAAHEIRQRAQLVRRYEPVPLVQANESRLGQVFLNLLLNAAQATPEGAVEEHQVTVTARPGREGWVLVEVSDTGKGIAAEHLPHIFEPFFTTKPVGVGTGLGLSVCHGIVTGLGGSIEVESEPGQGTTFRVLLPVGAPSARVLPAGKSAEPRSVTSRRVLVIDDDPEVRLALSRIIGSPHVVELAETARDAKERLLTRREDYDVVFCDLMMPDVTGMDLHDALSEQRPEFLGRMVYMTAGTFTPRATEFLERVAERRVDKPFDPVRVRSFL
ncbi:PAS domain S-box protein [Hyalangium gracile]|uniref:PAS domain S-box protein n=1 Tax=Hyalangium gracile TaxID=394092 RepID=UPI001CCF1C20|nr:PAS domain S-box protein [Hyalangium gracile]